MNVSLSMILLAAFSILPAEVVGDVDAEERIGRLDGVLAAAESDSPPLSTGPGDTRIVVENDGPFLWVRVRSQQPGVASLCLAEGKTVTVLHASAALGMVRYRSGDNGWSLEGKFDWALRDASLSALARAARLQHLAQHGWVATTSRMGDPDLFEFLIRRDRLAGDGARLAVGIMPMKPPNEVFGVPAESAGDCAHDKLVKGPPPVSGLRFDPSNWLALPSHRRPAHHPHGAGPRSVLGVEIHETPSAAAWHRACRATMPVGARTRPALQALTSRTVETGQSTARNLDLAFRHRDSRKFEGEAARVALVCAVWGPLIVGESARSRWPWPHGCAPGA